ncbi:hypothetical protein GGI42DRAFT_364452 [Trichoderma sp. SZMC 28013]
MASQDFTNMPLDQDWTTMPAEENWTTMSLEQDWEMLKPVWEYNMQNPDGSLPEVGFPDNFNEQSAMTNGQPQWDLLRNNFFEPMVFDQQDQVAAINTALMPPPDTTFFPAPDTTFFPAPYTTFMPAPDTTFFSAPDTTFIPALDTTTSPTNTPSDSASDAITPPISNTISATNTGNTQIPGGFHCPECGVRFSKRSALNTHLRSSRAHPHEDVKCRCGKSFEKYGLRQHLKQQVKKCTKSQADFQCHCGFVVAAEKEQEILGHAYACTRRRNPAAGQ